VRQPADRDQRGLPARAAAIQTREGTINRSLAQPYVRGLITGPCQLRTLVIQMC
jgi:hypothetical protein